MKVQLIALPIAVLFLLLSVVLGVVRLLALQGFITSPFLTSLIPHHGELIVFGALTPLILTERYLGATTFKLNQSISFMPVLAAISAVFYLFFWMSGVPLLNVLAIIAITLAVVLYLYLLYGIGKQSAQSLPFHFMILAALTLLASAYLSTKYTTAGNTAFTLLLVSFPVFTIIGERVELSRFLAPNAYYWARWSWWLGVLASLILILRVTLVSSTYLVSIWAVLMAATVSPLLRPELTLVRAGKSPLHRYLGRHLLFSYLWFFIGLVVLVLARESYPLYDAGTHAIAIGFVLTMILAHAPVIAPVITGSSLNEAKLGYYPAVLLSLSVAMRIAGHFLAAAGINIPALAGFSGVVALLAIIVFAAMLIRAFRTTS